MFSACSTHRWLRQTGASIAAILVTLTAAFPQGNDSADDLLVRALENVLVLEHTEDRDARRELLDEAVVLLEQLLETYPDSEAAEQLRSEGIPIAGRAPIRLDELQRRQQVQPHVGSSTTIVGSPEDVVERMRALYASFPKDGYPTKDEWPYGAFQSIADDIESLFADPSAEEILLQLTSGGVELEKGVVYASLDQVALVRMQSGVVFDDLTQPEILALAEMFLAQPGPGSPGNRSLSGCLVRAIMDRPNSTVPGNSDQSISDATVPMALATFLSWYEENATNDFYISLGYYPPNGSASQTNEAYLRSYILRSVIFLNIPNAAELSRNFSRVTHFPNGQKIDHRVVKSTYDELMLSYGPKIKAAQNFAISMGLQRPPEPGGWGKELRRMCGEIAKF